MALVVKSPPANAGEVGEAGLMPGLGRSPGEGRGNPLQCSCLENPRDGGASWAAVYGVAQGQTRLKLLSSGSSIPEFISYVPGDLRSKDILSTKI